MELMYYYIPGLFTILLFVFFKSKQYTLKNQPPSQPSRPLFGHLHLVKEPVNRTLQAVSAMYGDILLLRFGVRKALLLTSPSAVEECFTKNDIIFANRPFRLAAKHLSYNYTTLSVAPYGDHWHNLRRLAATEIFSPSRIAMFTNTRRKEVMLLLSELVKKCEVGGGFCKVDLKSKFIELAFNTLSMTIAGRRYYGENVEDDEEARKVQFIIREMLVMSGNSNLGDFLPFLQWFDFKGLEKKFSTLMKKLDGFMQDLVDERRRVFLAADCVAEKTILMIDHLLSLQQKEPSYYTDELIKGIVMVLIIAGTDTMSISMEWAMALLLNHPEAIKKVKAEIDTHVLQDRLLNEEDVPKLSYLQNVITETLRLYPPVPFLIPHQSSEDCKVGGYDISKGTMLLVNLWAIQRDPKIWENPTEFIPERHEERTEGGFMMLPFGTGRRGCTSAGIVTWISIGNIGSVF